MVCLNRLCARCFRLHSGRKSRTLREHRLMSQNSTTISISTAPVDCLKRYLRKIFSPSQRKKKQDAARARAACLKIQLRSQFRLLLWIVSIVSAQDILTYAAEENSTAHRSQTDVSLVHSVRARLLQPESRCLWLTFYLPIKKFHPSCRRFAMLFLCIYDKKRARGSHTGLNRK